MNATNKNDRIYIEFGEEHYNPLGLIRSLGETGIRPVAIITKGDFRFASKSKYISKLFLVDTIEDGYKVLIENYGNEKNKPILYTTDDKVTSFLDNHYEEIKDKFIFYNAGKNGRITEFMDKDNINKLAVKHGFKVAKNWVVKPGEIPKDIEYPIMTKAIISTLENWKSDVFICNNEDELKEAYKAIRSKEVLIQKYINKKNELCIDGYSVNRGNNVFYAIATNYNNIIKNAYSNYMRVMNCNYSQVEQKLSKMFKEIGFEGIFSVEFLIDQNDDLYFLEINFRNSTWSWASTKAGMNLPVLWANAMEDNKIVEKSYKEFKQFNAMAEFNDFKDRVKSHEVTFFQWFRQMLECKCLYFLDIKDMGPIFSRINHKIVKILKRRK